MHSHRPCLDKPVPEGDCASACRRYARIDFTWGLAGLINVVARFVAIPDITLKSSSSSIDQTVLAAFVLLVLLTAAQTGLLIYSVFHGTRAGTSVWTMIQANVLQHLFALCALFSGFCSGSLWQMSHMLYARLDSMRGPQCYAVDAADGAPIHAACVQPDPASTGRCPESLPASLQQELPVAEHRCHCSLLKSQTLSCIFHFQSVLCQQSACIHKLCHAYIA